jgi:hypothetical protein
MLVCCRTFPFNVRERLAVSQAQRNRAVEANTDVEIRLRGAGK